MRKQSDINAKMRSILFDWLVEVHLKFKLVPETLFMTCGLIDRYLEKEKVMRDKLQLVGIAAMFIASKYEETFAPESRSLVESTAPLGLAVMSRATRAVCVSPGDGCGNPQRLLSPQVHRLGVRFGPRVHQGGPPADGGLHPRHPRLPANHQSDRFPLPQTGNLRMAGWHSLRHTALAPDSRTRQGPTHQSAARVEAALGSPTARRPFYAQVDESQRARLPEALRQGGVPCSQPRRAALAARAARTLPGRADAARV